MLKKVSHTVKRTMPVPEKRAEIDARIKQLHAMDLVLARLNACSCATFDECGQRVPAMNVR